MAYRSNVHKSTGLSPYRLMFREECTLPMDAGLPRRDQDLPGGGLRPGSSSFWPGSSETETTL